MTVADAAASGYAFTGAHYDPALDYARLGTHMERIRALMLDGTWRTPGEIAIACHLPATADITKQLRHLRYATHGLHHVATRRRGPGSDGLFEYRVGGAGTGSVTAGRRCGHEEQLLIDRLTIALLTDALRRADPAHPLLSELDA